MVSIEGLAQVSGVVLAEIAIVFGVFFLAFAAKYYCGIIAVLWSKGSTAKNGNGKSHGNGSEPPPLVSVQVALYNEKNVADRLLTACSKLTYPNFEVVVVDDSTDETMEVLEKWSADPRFKIIHRENRRGFKGGALNMALEVMDPAASFVAVFDADFVPSPDTIERFLEYFAMNGHGGGSRYENGDLAVVQGYQWHTLNRSENWLTQAVTCEYSGNYMVERTFAEIAGLFKMVAGSVFMIRAKVLREFRWSTSLTEDWELTLRLYARGYKVLYTPLIQTAAECPSTLSRLIRQRMRWAEGHTFNVKKHFLRILYSADVTNREKADFVLLAPYYMQSFLLILGTAFWFISDFGLKTRLPFWNVQLGWGLILTNLLALPLMQATGLFLERRAKTDVWGVVYTMLLTYALAPYQALAAIRGLVELHEGSWSRTFKTGRVAGSLGKLQPRKVVDKVLPPRKRGGGPISRLAKAWRTVAAAAFAALLLAVVFQGAIHPSSGWSSQPGFYFYDQAAPSAYHPYSGTASGESFLMLAAAPQGQDTSVSICTGVGTGPLFFSQPAPTSVSLPSGSSVSATLWINSPSQKSGHGNQEKVDVKIEIFNPQGNTVKAISGVGDWSFQLGSGLDSYQESWGDISQGQTVPKGDTVLAVISLSGSGGCQGAPDLVFNSAAHPSNIGFPVTVQEDVLPLAGVGLLTFGGSALALRLVNLRGDPEPTGEEEAAGTKKVERVLLVTAAATFLTLPLLMSFSDVIATGIQDVGLDRVVSVLVPYEASGTAALLNAFGLNAGSSPNSVWLTGGFLPVFDYIGWNCSGWQSLLIFGACCAVGLRQVRGWPSRAVFAVIGTAGTFAVNVARIFLVVAIERSMGYLPALIFHDYGGAVITLVWLAGFWGVALKGGRPLTAALAPLFRGRLRPGNLAHRPNPAWRRRTPHR